MGNVLQEVSALEFLARVHTHLNQPRKAADAAERAVTLSRKTGTPLFLGGALDEVGRAYRDMGRKKEAEQAFRESIKWTEVQRAELSGGDTSGASFLNGRESPYSSLMDLRASDGDALEAIQISEQVRARWLLDAMAQAKVDPQQGLSAEEKQKEQSLAGEAARWNAQLSQPNPPAGAKESFDKAARDLGSYRSDLYSRHEHLKARLGQPEVLTSARMQSLVPESKDLLIEYSFSERGSWIFTVSRGSGNLAVVKATRLRVKQEELAERVEKFRAALATRDLSYKTLAQQLYVDLLEPVEADLKGRSIIGIVPDGVLWNLPFQALEAGDGRYLIEQAAVYYEPSLTSLSETAAVPVSNVKLRPLLALGAGAGELPYASQEVQALAQLYGPSAVALTGAQATEERWKQEAQGARVLHVATHGILNHANPMFSFVQLAKSGTEDGMLEAREILNTNLHAELLVLSACETGRGELITGEGLLGMSWAAMTAGVPTVVVSQWKVDSASTTQLMVAFHRIVAPEALRPGPIRGKAEALRRAEIELIHTPGYQHPFYWAGFDMLGNGY
jgi:CHAT domain-containing protein